MITIQNTTDQNNNITDKRKKIPELKHLTVALVGQPNVGKSTMINKLVGLKISIATSKVQTTRENCKGIVNIDNTQLIFVDTPGLFESRSGNKLENFIVKNAWQGIKNADVIALIIDASNIQKLKQQEVEHLHFLIKQFNTQYRDKKLIILLNKWDLVVSFFRRKIKKHPISSTNPTIQGTKNAQNTSKITRDTAVLIKQYKEEILKNLFKTFQNTQLKDQHPKIKNKQNSKEELPTVFCTSAGKNMLHNNLVLENKEFIQYLISYANKHCTSCTEWPFSAEMYTDASQAQIAEEMTREKIYKHLNKELPYSIQITTESWKENNQRLEIHQSIVVLKESQKKIILGYKGIMIKKISLEARKEIERILNQKVSLFLFVKVRDNWIEKL